tara:strand:- start:7842 stop:9128 length:1287 start_codon:yes stop_codon:yes gene_type:complete
MNIIKYIKKTTLIVGFALLGFACTDSNNDSDTATISGKVNGSNQKSLATSADVISAGYIQSDGSIRNIEGTEVNTDASGRFNLAVNADAFLEIVVQAKSEGETTLGYSSTKIENGESYIIKPIDSESSAETKVFAELVESGRSGMINKSEIETVITNRNAVIINSNAINSSTIASGLENSAMVRTNYFSNKFKNEADAKLDFIANAMINAQVKLETQLNSAISVEAREEAYTSFRSDFIDAYLNAEMKASTAAKAVEMWGRVFITSTNILSDEIKAETNIQVSLITATLIDAAVRAEMDVVGAEQSSKEAIIEAGLVLRSDINASTGMIADIRTAFEKYHDDVKTSLENDSNISATTVVAVDGEINSASGSKTTFDNSIASRVSVNLVMQAYNNFYNSIESSVKTNSNGSEKEIEALTELMILINTAS